MRETRRCAECQAEFTSEELAGGFCHGCLLTLALRASPPPPRVALPQQIGNYRILGLLGEGGMGAV